MSLRVAALAASPIWSGATSAGQPWFGRWIVDPKFCTEVGDTAETMPLIVKANTMEWFVARCTYRAAIKRGDRWHVNARCSAESVTEAMPIVLQMRGDRLVVWWDGGRPEQLQRCP